ncbi:MAG: glycosyltransferase family 4 protein [Natrialbaceae archaeon]|nr:glycosyltransferase family 4 protein [Natrialbaceae archaeon]
MVPPSISIPTSIPDSTPGGPVFTISRLVKRKNVETIIDAWQLLPQYIRQKHGLIIAGEGDQRPLLEIKSSNDDTIQVLGRVSNEMKEMLLRDAAVFSLVPVQDGFDVEGFGIVYLEAQASGTPVVGSSTGGVPEAVGDAGILVDSPRDSEAVATALKELLTNETTRRSCYNSINNRIQDFDIKHVAQEHVSRYQELL